MEDDLSDMTIDELTEILEQLVFEGLVSKVFDEKTGEPLYAITGKGSLQVDYKLNHKN